MSTLQIRVDDVQHPAVIALLRAHVDALRQVSPPESCHVLDLAALRRPELSLWTAWDGLALAGCGALKALSATLGEIKSMRTAAGHERKGVASALLRHMIDEARRRGYTRLSLETGSMAYFVPARQLYERFGFVECGPFEGYVEDPNSVFMTLVL